MEFRIVIGTVGLGLAYLLWGKEFGRWGVAGVLMTRRGSIPLGLALSMPAILWIQHMPPVVLVALFALLPASFVLFRVRQVGTWNIVGLDMRKISCIGDLATKRISTGSGSIAGLDELAALMRDSDWRVRRCAAEAIGARPSELATAYLAKASVDPDWRVQLEAVKSIGRICQFLHTNRKLALADMSKQVTCLHDFVVSPFANQEVIREAERWLERLGYPLPGSG